MIREDRVLLARLTRTNTRLGDVVLELISHQDSGEIAPEGWRALGGHLAQLGADLLARADEQDTARMTVLDANDDGAMPWSGTTWQAQQQGEDDSEPAGCEF